MAAPSTQEEVAVAPAAKTVEAVVAQAAAEPVKAVEAVVEEVKSSPIAPPTKAVEASTPKAEDAPKTEESAEASSSDQEQDTSEATPVEPSIPEWKEESNLVSDLKESEKKALEEFKIRIQKAITEGEFKVPKKVVKPSKEAKAVVASTEETAPDAAAPETTPVAESSAAPVTDSPAAVVEEKAEVPSPSAPVVEVKAEEKATAVEPKVEPKAVVAPVLVEAKAAPVVAEKVEAKAPVVAGKVEAKAAPVVAEKVEAKAAPVVAKKVEAKAAPVAAKKVEAKAAPVVAEKVEAKVVAPVVAVKVEAKAAPVVAKKVEAKAAPVVAEKVEARAAPVVAGKVEAKAAPVVAEKVEARAAPVVAGKVEAKAAPVVAEKVEARAAPVVAGKVEAKAAPVVAEKVEAKVVAPVVAEKVEAKAAPVVAEKVEEKAESSTAVEKVETKADSVEVPAETTTDVEVVASPDVEAEAAGAEVEEEPEDSTPPEDISLWGVPLLYTKGDKRTDVILLKFLRAREFSVKEAFKQLRNAVIWRKTFKADNLINEEFGTDLDGVAYMHGVSRDGQPVCYNVPSVFQDKELYQKTFGDAEKLNNFLRWRVQILEKGIQLLSFTPEGPSSMVQITDLKNAPGPAKRDFKAAANQAINLLQDNYPELSSKRVFINVPRYFSAMYAVVSPLLSKRTKSKFVVAPAGKTTECLLKLISADNIPVQYGGLSRPNDTEFTTGSALAQELLLKGGKATQIDIDVIEAGSTVVWDLSVIGFDVTYGAEFVPSAEGSYTTIIEKSKKLPSTTEEPVRNSFKAIEAGKVVLSVGNLSRKKKTILYRYLVKGTPAAAEETR